MKRIYTRKSVIITLMALLCCAKVSWGQTNPAPQAIPFTQTFGTTTFTTMPAGTAAWTAGGNKTTQAAAESSVPAADATVTAATASQTGGNVYGYATLSNGRLYIQESSNATNGTNQLGLAFNTGTATSVDVSYQLELVNAGSTTQDYGIELMYHSGSTATAAWTSVTGSPLVISTATTAYTTTTYTFTISGLTASTNYQLRFATWRPAGSGNSKGVGIDNITVAPSTTISTSAISPLSYCSGTTVSVPYTVTGTFVSGNTFTAQLSDASGSFTSATAIGSTSSTSAGTISATIPNGQATGSGYRIRVMSSTPSITGSNNGSNITITQLPSATIAYSGFYCTGVSAPQSVTLTGSTGGTFSSTSGLSVNSTTGAITPSTSTAGTYTVTYTMNAGACATQTATTTVNINTSPTVTVTPSAPSYCPGGSVSLTAAGATTYAWSPGTGLSATTGATVTANPSSTTTYSVQGTDNGCSTTTNVTVTVNTNPVATCSHTNATSIGGTEGSVSVVATGGSGTYTYLWTGGATTSTVTNLGAGTYTVTVTDANGCSSTCSSTIIEVLTLAANCSLNNNVTCNGGANGSASVVANNGTAPYSYLWSSGATTATATGLAAGTYDVTVTDALNNTASCQITINQPPAYTVTANSNSPVCEGNAVNFTATSSSTILPNSFSWSGPNSFTATGATASIAVSILAADGVYTVTATNGDGCTSTTTTTVVVNPAVTVAVTPSGPAICAGLSTTLTASGASSYTWSPSTALSATTGSVVNANPASTTIYTVTGTSAFGCTNSTTVTVTVNPLPSVAVSPSVATVCAGASSVLTATGAATYAWTSDPTLSSLTGSPVTATPTATTTYSVTGTDGNGCVASANTTITVTPVTNAVSPSALATGVSGTVDITWSNPTSCVDEIIIVAAPALNTGIPTGNGSTYNGGAYGTGTALGNGFIVYKGSTSPQSITGLTDATKYFFKLFTRSGSVWSTGTTDVSAIPYIAASLSEVILPQYAINGNTAVNRLHYACRLQLSNLNPNATYKYSVGASNVTTITTGSAAGNMYAINNTAGASGYITGYTSSKSFGTSAVLLNGNNFLSTAGYAQFTTDATGNYAGWFGFVPTGNAVFANGNSIYFYVQLNGGTNGAGDTSIVQSVHTTNTIKMISEVSPASSARAVRGSSKATPENMIMLYDNTQGTGRPIAGTWAENDSITTSYQAWYDVVDGAKGSWGAYIPTALPNGICRIEQRDIATGSIAGCADTATAGVWVTAAGNVNTVNPTFGISALYIDSLAAPLKCPILNTISTDPISGTSFCIDPLNGASIAVPFSATYPFNSGNVFTAQLSNASGSFAAPVTIGTLALAPSTNYAGSISAIIPAGTPVGTGYRIRVISSDPAIIGTNNGSDIGITGGLTYYYDNDFDGYGDDFNTTVACIAPGGYITVGGDCNDFDEFTNPLAVEVCDLMDNDCDGLTDEGVTSTFYADADGDTYGNAAVTAQACTAPVGYVANNTDCNDAAATIYPSATELCNGVDDNCNGTIDEGCSTFTYFADADGDGFGNPAVSTTTINPVPPSGYVTNNTDCNDAVAAINPAASEICNGIDDNCNSLVDDGLLFLNYYADNDLDTYGGAFVGNFCSQPIGSVTMNGDCDDNNAAINPNAIELCNNTIDDNCNGTVDETSLVAAESHTVIACFGGTSTVTISATGGISPYSGTGSFTQSAGSQNYTVTDAATCTATVTVTLTQPTAISITSFAPAIGLPGSSVVITGSGFTGATAVTLNGSNVASFVVNSNTQITAVVQAGATSGLIAVTKGTCTVTSATSYGVVSMTELVIPKYMGSKSASGTNNSRSPYVACVQFNNLLPNTLYNISAGLGLVSDAAATSGVGNLWNGTAFSGNTFVGAFTTNASGNSGPYWIYVQPTGNATRFGAGQVHNLRVSYYTGASAPGSPIFISTKTTTALDIPTTALTPATTDDGAFLTGALANCTGGKYALIYDNVAGTGDPLYATAIKTMPYTNTAQTDLPAAVNTIWLNTTAPVGSFAAVIPIGANNPNGVRRIEVRTAQNTIYTSETDADGIWPSGANTTTAARRAVIALTSSDALASTVTAVSTTTTPVLCNGGTTGSATVTGTTSASPISYLWTPGSASTATISGLTAGTYTVTATDANGCTRATTAVVAQPTALSANESHAAITCNGGSTTVTVTGTGGTAPYTGEGSFPQFAGTQSYNITDANGCAFTLNVTITQPNALTLTSFAPAAGTVGSTVVISGTGFTGATAVSFNGTNAPVFTVNTDGQITVTVPTGATTGTIAVTVGTCGTATSSGIFTVLTDVTFHLRAYIQGYYSGGQMAPVLLNQSAGIDPAETDTLRIELRDQTVTTTVVAAASAVVDTAGHATFTLPGSVNGGSYYVAVFHRNAVQTWSANPVLFSGTTNYDFSTDSTKAYGDNEVNMGDGKFAFFSGDYDQSEAVDIFDFPLYDFDNLNFGSGYLTTDINGDGGVDIFDFPTYDANNLNFVGSIHP